MLNSGITVAYDTDKTSVYCRNHLVGEITKHIVEDETYFVARYADQTDAEPLEVYNNSKDAVNSMVSFARICDVFSAYQKG